jgi:hypothetical protein
MWPLEEMMVFSTGPQQQSVRPSELRRHGWKAAVLWVELPKLRRMWPLEEMMVFLTGPPVQGLDLLELA